MTPLSFKDHGQRRVREDLPDLVAIVSGGQTGADACGLRAGRRLGLKTGGHAPEGWKTLDGPAPWLGTEFGLVEFGRDYPPRTARNVHRSDATCRLAEDFLSPGERCTLKAITKYGRPYLDISLSRSSGSLRVVHGYDPGTGARASGEEQAAQLLVDFLRRHKVRILNVAGNSLKTAPGIDLVAEEFLVHALQRQS